MCEMIAERSKRTGTVLLEKYNELQRAKVFKNAEAHAKAMEELKKQQQKDNESSI